MIAPFNDLDFCLGVNKGFQGFAAEVEGYDRPQFRQYPLFVTWDKDNDAAFREYGYAGHGSKRQDKKGTDRSFRQAHGLW